MNAEEIIEIMDGYEDYNDNDGDDAFNGLVIIGKYTKEVVRAAEHDMIFSASVEELAEAGITRADVEKLGQLNWFIDEDCFCKNI